MTVKMNWVVLGKGRTNSHVHPLVCTRQVDDSLLGQPSPVAFGDLTHMVPVVQENVSEINIIVCSCRTIDLDSTKDTGPGLDVEVGVTTSAVLSCAPTVGK
jgi:hypothetical protein